MVKDLQWIYDKYCALVAQIKQFENVIEQFESNEQVTLVFRDKTNNIKKEYIIPLEGKESLKNHFIYGRDYCKEKLKEFEDTLEVSGLYLSLDKFEFYMDTKMLGKEHNFD